MQGFKKFGGEEIQDLGLYVRNYMLDHENVVLSVGCDSDEHKRQDLYAIAVCFYHIGCGGHIVFKREWVPKKNVGRKISHVEERLWKEVERSKAVADYLGVDIVRRHTKENNIGACFGRIRSYTKQACRGARGFQSQSNHAG